MKTTLLIMLIAAWPGAQSEVPDDATSKVAVVPYDHVQQWIRGESDWEPDENTAFAAAQSRLYAACRDKLSAECPSVGERLLASVSLSKLLSRPDVLWRQNKERRDRAYGTMWRVQLEVAVPNATIDDWTGEMLAQVRDERIALVVNLGLTLLGVLCAGLLIRAVDRWTSGYRRGTAILMGGTMVTIVMFVIWSI